MKTNMTHQLVAIALFTCLAMPAAHAEGQFKKKHPRRAEVLGRDKKEKNRANNQEKINNTAAADGKLTQGQANKLDRQDQKIKREDNAIKRQEQADAAANGGHITKGEQRQLNREENKVNRQENGVARERSNMEKKDAASGSAPVAPVAPATSN